MKIKKIVEFQQRIMKNQRNSRIPHDNHENHENQRIPTDNHEKL